MASRFQRGEPEQLRRELMARLDNFSGQLFNADLRGQVRALVPVLRGVRDLGGSLMPPQFDSAGMARILAYFQMHVGQVIDGEELMVVSGIGDYPRRIRQLRVEQGWPILTGHSLRDMQEDAADEGIPEDLMPDQYVLVVNWRDEQAARRWEAANQIRKSELGVQDKVLAFFRANVGQPITSEELRYVANDRSEWARRTRELRTEEGWPIVTRFSGNPTLPNGVYVLERDQQGEVHDRHIPEPTRREVIRRDGASCRWRGCHWPHGFPQSDHRFLEVHHIEHHAAGGSNEAENLVTLCNYHHDIVHKTGELDTEPYPGA